MRLKHCMILAAGLCLLTTTAWAHPSDDYTEVRVFGSTSGNHDLSCTVIQPWGRDDEPDLALAPYPVIGWLNGWDQGNVIGQSTLQGYLPGLIQWVDCPRTTPCNAARTSPAPRSCSTGSPVLG